MSAAAVVVCALEVLGRSPSTLPPVALVRAPAASLPSRRMRRIMRLRGSPAWYRS